MLKQLLTAALETLAAERSIPLMGMRFTDGQKLGCFGAYLLTVKGDSRSASVLIFQSDLLGDDTFLNQIVLRKLHLVLDRVSKE